ncbi:MAG TPA: T9SS type A sorting domain-containing protein [Puia sp.]|nr:T9SS type A sorting domain-containing protein [Puia sp.]
MKHASISFATIAFLLLNIPVLAQSTYNINSSANWSSSLPSPCSACTINIGSGVTLTVDQTAVCQNCTFNGGAVSITSHTFNMQSSGGQSTSFSGTNLVASGTAKVNLNAPVSLTNAIFTFYNTSSLTTANSLSLTSSTIYLEDNTTMTSNGNFLTAIRLLDASRIVIGSGSLTSSASFTDNGPLLMVYDNSSVAVANQNNVYYNSSDYLYQQNASASIFTARIYSSSGLNLNCGGGYAHACSSPSLYGPATVASGVTSGAVLPIVLDGLTAELNANHTISLRWNTQMEMNFSHFTIQRSADGANWEDIGTVQAKGNSSVRVDYDYTDEQPLTGTNYYRLALVNLDDTYTYSDVKVLQEARITKVSFYPNPARDFVNVSIGGEKAGQVRVLLTSIGGQLMQEKTAAAGNGQVVSFPIRDLSAGMYVLSVVHADGTLESSPVMIAH